MSQKWHPYGNVLVTLVEYGSCSGARELETGERDSLPVGVGLLVTSRDDAEEDVSDRSRVDASPTDHGIAIHDPSATEKVI